MASEAVLLLSDWWWRKGPTKELRALLQSHFEDLDLHDPDDTEAGQFDVLEVLLANAFTKHFKPRRRALLAALEAFSEVIQDRGRGPSDALMTAIARAQVSGMPLPPLDPAVAPAWWETAEAALPWWRAPAAVPTPTCRTDVAGKVNCRGVSLEAIAEASGSGDLEVVGFRVPGVPRRRGWPAVVVRHAATSFHRIGDRLWSGAFHLVDWLLRGSLELSGRSVLELGAGTGLASNVMAAMPGAPAIVVASDMQQVVPTLQVNAELNFAPGRGVVAAAATERAVPALHPAAERAVPALHPAAERRDGGGPAAAADRPASAAAGAGPGGEADHLWPKWRGCAVAPGGCGLLASVGVDWTLVPALLDRIDRCSLEAGAGVAASAEPLLPEECDAAVSLLLSDRVVGSDLVYEPAAYRALAVALGAVFAARARLGLPPPSVHIASSVRSEDTISEFNGHLAAAGLQVKQLAATAPVPGPGQAAVGFTGQPLLVQPTVGSVIAPVVLVEVFPI